MTVELSPYLNFDGNAREAMQFYHGILGGELQLQTFGEVPGMEAPGYEDKIVHARLEADGFIIMASDLGPGMGLQVGRNVNLSLMGTDREGLMRIFDALAEGGDVGMPMAEQFWGDTFGMLTDRFGVPWMVNVNKS
jgi:PhnB protein